ncbi:MAG: DUF3570 domain-containing protein [Kangiellaceae bacterium]|jgi:hypothetical protein|nr:DUF3570 domain-containing protein [Kangiellaceae bacterium]
MQLKKGSSEPKPKYNSISSALALAASALVGPSSHAEGDFWDFSKDWTFDMGVLYYGEQDRVSAIEGVFSATHEAEFNDKFNFSIVLDSLTGASPSGAIVQQTTQTFTRPSGRGQYIAQAGEIPLDDTFQDTRLQLNAQWTKPAGVNLVANYGVHFSKEYDYLSFALNGGLAWDFNKSNTTLSLGASIANDTYEPVGGVPKPLDSMVIDLGQFNTEADYQNAFDETRINSSDDRQTTDLLLGVTQVINRSTIMQFNYSYSNVTGYLNDPYKVISVVDASGIALGNLYEKRPDNREKHSFFWQTKHHLDESVLDISYRYFTDDWDITSHTIEYKHLFYLGEDSFIEPQLRYYSQAAANFYAPYLLQSQPTPEFTSADIRLGEYSALTFGLKYGWQSDNGNQSAVRFSYYKQSPQDIFTSNPGILSQTDIYPNLDAIFIQYTYSF